MIAELIKIFFAGMMLANGPCLFICVPIILPCISGLPGLGENASGWRTGLWFAIVFSIFRLTAYSLLGLFSVIFYRFVFDIVASKGLYLQPILGVLIIAVGIGYLLTSSQKLIRTNSLCGSLRDKFQKKSFWHMALFGLLVGFSPCPPLLAVLTYIAATAPNPLWGFFTGFIFGLGTIVTPLIPLATFAGLIMEKIRKLSGLHLGIRIVSALILIYFGLQLMFR